MYDCSKKVFPSTCVDETTKDAQEFKTDIAFFTVKDLSSEDVIKVIFIAKDFSGCVYERLIDNSFLQELSPLFCINSSFFLEMIKSRPTTTFEKDSILCKYKFPILGKEQEITFPLEQKFFDSDTILKNSVQSDLQLKTITTVMKKLFTTTYLHDNVFSRSDLDAMSFHGLLTITNPDGKTFLHEAINKGYKLEDVEDIKNLFNVDILDRFGFPPLYIHYHYSDRKSVKLNAINWEFDVWKAQYELTLQIVKSGCDLNFCHPTYSKDTLFLTRLRNYPSGFGGDDDSDKNIAYLELIKEMLKRGADVKGVTFSYSGTNEYPPFGSPSSSLIKDLVKLLMSHGAIFR